MSKKRQNFHYHYAEQYETRAERRARMRRKKRFVVPPAALLLSFVLLVLFGTVSLTFSVYVTDSFDDPDMPSSGGLVVSVKNDTVRTQLQSVNLRDKDDLASTAAKVDLAATGVNYAGKTIYLESVSSYSDSYGKTYLKVYKQGTSTAAFVEASGTVTYGSKSYYTFVVPSGTWDRMQCVRADKNSTPSSDSDVWTYSNSSCSTECNACYQTWNVSNGNYSAGTTSYFNLWVPGTVLYFDGTQNTSWDDYNMYVSSTNSSSSADATTKIADHLWKYTFTSAWDNCDAYWRRGSATTTLWNYTKKITPADYYYNSKNAVSPTGSTVSNGDGTVANLTLSSLTAPTISISTESTFKADSACTITVTNAASIVLNYTFNSGSRTTGLTDKLYTYYLDGVALNNTPTSSATYTIPANYFDDSSNLKGYGSDNGHHTITVQVSSALTGLAANTASGTSIFVKSPHSCFIYANSETELSKTFAFGDSSASYTITTYDHTDGANTITATSADSTKVLVSTDNTNFYTSVNLTDTGDRAGAAGTLYLKPLKPGTADVTVACQVTAADENVDSTPAVIHVTVTEPTLTFDALSIEEYYTKTLTIASSSVTPSHYSWSTSSGAISFTDADAASLSITANAYSTGSATVTLSATYDAYNYTKTFDATVTLTASTIGVKSYIDSWTDHKMVYSPSLTATYGLVLYTYTYTNVSGSSNYQFCFTENGTAYKNGGTVSESAEKCWLSDIAGGGDVWWDFDTGSNNCTLSTGARGSYTFYYNPANHRMFVDFPGIEYYLLGMNGGWTGTSSQQMIETTPGSKIYTITKTFNADTALTAGNATSGFKVWCNDEHYYGKSSTTLTQLSNTATLEQNTADSYNLGLTGTYSGDYVFTYNATTKVLTVTYPSRTVTVNAILSADSSTLGSVNLSGTSNDYLTLAYASNDQFTVTRKTTSAIYQHSYWVSAGNTGASYTFTVNSTTPVTVNSYWEYHIYTVTYHTFGGAMGATDANGGAITGSGDTYTGQYTYGTGLASFLTPSMPPSKSYCTDGWYTSYTAGTKTFSGAKTSIGTTETGNIDLYYRWMVSVTFKDNITNSQIGDIRYVTAGTPATAPFASAEDYPEHVGFRFSNTFSNSWTPSMNMSGNAVIHAIYVPVTQSFTITLDTTGASADVVYDSEHDKYIIPYGAKIGITAAATIPSAISSDTYAADIYYQWSESADGTYHADDEWNKKNSFIFTNPDITSLMSLSTTGTYTLHAKAYYRDCRNVIVWDTSSQQWSISYDVHSALTNTLSRDKVQKIYQVNPSIIARLGGLSASYDDLMTLNTDYAVKMQLQVYDSANDAFEDNGALVSVTKTDGSYLADLGNYIANGIYYVKAIMMRPMLIGIDEGATGGTDGDVYKVDDDIQYTEDVQSHTDTLRITVGTVQGLGTRPLYMTSEQSLVSTGQIPYRVILFYINSRGVMTYQTGESFDRSGTKTYRFQIPADVEEVQIGVYDVGAFFILPTYSAGELDFSHTKCVAYTDDWFTVKSGDTPVQKMHITINGTTHVITPTASAL